MNHIRLSQRRARRATKEIILRRRKGIPQRIDTVDPAPRCGAPEGRATAPAPFVLREPLAEDGPAVTALIAACPPLDANSAYCNLLQCSHFAGSCIVAERDGAIMGWISGYRLPRDPSVLFVWQVAVSSAARGQRLAGRMLDSLLARPGLQGVRQVHTTVTPDNAASWAMFRNWARWRGARLGECPFFDSERHFAGHHESEWLIEIGPLAPQSQGLASR